jgi:hypothetical protein
MKTTLQILTDARALLKGGGKWCKGANARGLRGTPVDPNGKYAVCFCAQGVLLRVAGRQGIFGAKTALQNFTLPMTLLEFNDQSHRTKREVIDLFTQAIKAERKHERHA